MTLQRREGKRGEGTTEAASDVVWWVGKRGRQGTLSESTRKRKKREKKIYMVAGMYHLRAGRDRNRWFRT